MRPLLLAAAALVLASAAPPRIDFVASPGDAGAEPVRAMAATGAAQVEAFFGAPFPDTVHFRVAPDRAAFDKAFPPALGMGATQCWMVGMGVADLMVVLSPARWKDQACDHDPGDAVELQRLVTHELTHVYHAQHNAARDFAGEDDLAWFIEGVAVLVSGQLDAKRIADVRQAIAAGAAPGKLDDVWSGKLKYGFAGSLVGYVDGRWGRAMTRRLLAARSSAEALAMLGTDEATLLADWKRAAG